MDGSKTNNLEPCEPRADGPAWRAAEAAGHDMSLIIANLRLPVAERMRRHDVALTAALAFQEAFLKEHGFILAN